MSRTWFATALVALLLASAPGAHASELLSSRVGGLQSLMGASCPLYSAACNQTFTSHLGPEDCQYTSGNYAEVWLLPGIAGQFVGIGMNSTDFDSVVGLATPGGAVVATDDDSGGGLNAYLTYTLTESGEWKVVATTFFGYETGNYDLEISCSTPGGACVPDSRTLCIDDSPGDHRYEITVDYSSSAGSGQGHAVPLSTIGLDRGGMFWFFNSSNPEMLIKVLQGCTVTNHHWVFFAATTNVQFAVHVTDTQAGLTKTYTNPNGHAADAVTDTAAFQCP